jgi:hypothetical protein
MWHLQIYFHRIHRNSLLDPVMSQINPVHSLASYFFNFHFNTLLQCILLSPKLHFPLRLTV